MKILQNILLLLIITSSLNAEEKTTLKFNQTDYLYRGLSGEQHEFTPKGQKDLKKWKDMITVIKFPQASSEDLLANTANNILGGYEKAGHIVSTNSTPKTDTKPAEHTIVVIFVAKEFMEVVFNRLVMIDGKGHAVIYSHRIYGKKNGAEVSKWAKDNQTKIEKALMAIPTKDIAQKIKMENKPQ